MSDSFSIPSGNTYHGRYIPQIKANYLTKKPLKNTLTLVKKTRNLEDKKSSDMMRHPSHELDLWPLPDLLYAVQKSGIFKDNKDFVDRPLRFGLVEVKRLWDLFLERQSYESLDEIDSDCLKNFVSEISDEPGTDVMICYPKDWKAKDDTWLSNINSPHIRNWALFLNNEWKKLCRETKCNENPGQHSLIALRRPFFIPGERFREMYYWDSYWTIIGLLSCNMEESASDLTRNLLDFVQEYGYVPNGNRIYYLNRSQPPLLSEMVKKVWEKTQEKTLLRRAMFLLIKEHEFWTHDPHIIKIKTKNLDSVYDNEICLSRYYTKWDKPRIESFRNDMETASNLTSDKQSYLFQQLATCAESGWDFSSRWFFDHKSLETSHITDIAPVDLNAFLYQMENNIAEIAKILGETTDKQYEKIENHFKSIADKRKIIFDNYFWNSETFQWCDYDTTRHEKDNISNVGVHHNDKSNEEYACNYIPLFCGITPPTEKDALNLIIHLKSSKLLNCAGISASLNKTGEQWDYPNAWPPIQHMIIDGLLKLSNKFPSLLSTANELAEDIALRFLKTIYISYEKYGHMFEKYDASSIGEVGTGGEYLVQRGFGWTNGVALWLLEKYGHLL